MASDSDTAVEEVRELLRMDLADLERRYRMLHLVTGERPVGFLLTVGAIPKRLMLPVGTGVTRVGRGASIGYAKESGLLSGVVEGAQWEIAWKPEAATVRDLGSTNGSVLVREAGLGWKSLVLGELLKSATICRLGWDGVKNHTEAQALRHGDILVNVFGALLYYCIPGCCPSVARPKDGAVVE